VFQNKRIDDVREDMGSLRGDMNTLRGDMNRQFDLLASGIAGAGAGERADHAARRAPATAAGCGGAKGGDPI
jgi:hypothetical protein